MKDPFGDYRESRDRHGIWTLKHTIYQQLSILDLPFPFHDYSSLHFGVRFVHFQCRCTWWLQCFPQIFDGTRLIKGTSDRGNVPVKEVIKLLCYETGKIPFLNLVGQSITKTHTLHSSFYNSSVLSQVTKILRIQRKMWKKEARFELKLKVMTSGCPKQTG